MHRQVRKLLPQAKGESKSVLVVNLDVRGFSKFSLEVDSVETALYIRKLYRVLLDDFYPEASFFKPTGDGLLLIFDIDEGNSAALTKVARLVIRRSLKLVKEFAALLDNDDWIYFPMPKRIGIGVARGAACRLHADDLTIDYSGTVLNIASRLMDIARPEGIILDQTFPFGLLTKTIKDQFVLDENVFLRSVAEEFPRKVYYRKDWTEISPANRRPLDEVQWKEKVKELSFAELCERDPTYRTPLDAEPLDPNKILVELVYPTKAPQKGKVSPLWTFTPDKDEWSYRNEAGRPTVHLDIDKITKNMAKDGIKQTWPVTYRIRYPT
jgi:hypothetical protein